MLDLHPLDLDLDLNPHPIIRVYSCPFVVALSAKPAQPATPKPASPLWAGSSAQSSKVIADSSSQPASPLTATPAGDKLAKSRKRFWPNFRSNNFVQSKRRASNTAVPISTHHAAVDYTEIANHAKLIIDTRSAMAKIPTSAG
jgi:hypothetical protein